MMKNKFAISKYILVSAAALLSMPAQSAGWMGAAPVKNPLVVSTAGDCSAIGERVASAQGGTLTKATPVVQNGRNVCVVVVLVPGRNGERPRRVEVAVPAD